MPKIPEIFPLSTFQGKLVIEMIKIDLLTSLGMFLGVNWKKGCIFRGKDAYKTQKNLKFSHFQLSQGSLSGYPG